MRHRKRYTFTFDPETFADFQALCEEIHMPSSRALEKLMESFIHLKRGNKLLGVVKMLDEQRE